MMACGEGRIEMVRTLCDSKADPELTDRTSFNALDYAITRNHHESVTWREGLGVDLGLDSRCHLSSLPPSLPVVPTW